MYYEHTLVMLREHRENDAKEVTKVIDTIEVEVIATRGKRASTGVAMTVEHENEVETLTA